MLSNTSWKGNGESEERNVWGSGITEYYTCVASNWSIVCLSEFIGKIKSKFLPYCVSSAWKILHKKLEFFSWQPQKDNLKIQVQSLLTQEFLAEN